tara:strand:- start:93 stop:551 length:459 start_codon:yes stop_codon:yes gene_type:complete
MALSAKDQKFEQKMREIMSGERLENIPELPEDLSMFELPEVEDYFKMQAIIDTGSIRGWQKLREAFILNRKNLPGKQDLRNQNAALLNYIKNTENLSAEDQLMNDFGVNDVIDSIDRGTVNIDDGADQLQKQQIIEGDMPGQGKSKEGNWRG